MKLGKTLLLIVAGLQAFSALMLMFVGSGPGTFQADTGVAWNDLIDVFPTVGEQFLMAQQSALVGTLAVALLAIGIIAYGFRPSEKWAWYTMWVLPAFMLPGTISLAMNELQWGVAVFGGAIVLMAVIGLLVSYKDIFNPTG